MTHEKLRALLVERALERRGKWREKITSARAMPNTTNVPPTRGTVALAVKTTTETGGESAGAPADGYSSSARAVALMALVQLALFAGARWEFSGGAALLSLVMSTAAAKAGPATSAAGYSAKGVLPPANPASRAKRRHRALPAGYRAMRTSAR